MVLDIVTELADALSPFEGYSVDLSEHDAYCRECGCVVNHDPDPVVCPSCYTPLEEGN